MRLIISFLSITLMRIAVYSEEISIFEVRRNIPLSDSEPVYKDFYIKGGESAGLKKNQIVQVFRKVSFKDSSGSQVIGDINAPVGQLKIIAVFGKMSVAREYKTFTREDLPVLDNPWFLIGDQIDLKDSFIEKSKKL